MTKLTGELKVNDTDSSGLTPLFFAVVSKKVSLLIRCICHLFFSNCCSIEVTDRKLLSIDNLSGNLFVLIFYF